MSPVKIKPDEEIGGEGSGDLAPSIRPPALLSARGSLLVSGAAWQAEQDTDLETQWPISLPGPGPHPARVADSLAFPAPIHELGRKPSLFPSASPLSRPPAVSLGSPLGLAPVCAAPSPAPAPILGTIGAAAVLHPRARRQQLQSSSAFTEVVLMPSSMT